MSVENTKPRINAKKLEAWLNAHCKSNECPFCKEADWTVVSAHNFVGCALPFGDGKGDMYMTGIPIVPLLCKKCYFIRNIALIPSLLNEVLEPDTNASV